MGERVLLLVDLQNDFLPGGALAVPQGDQIIPLINELQGAFSCIVATKDWHPPHHISFASHHGKKAGERVEIEGRPQELWPDHCVQGTPGAEFPTALHTEKIEKVFFKGTDPHIDSYSAFYDNAHLRSTNLGSYLKALGIKEVYIVGLVTEYCVKYTALDAIELGFKTYVIIDACRGIDLQPGTIDRAIQEMQTIGVVITNCRAFQN